MPISWRRHPRPQSIIDAESSDDHIMRFARQAGESVAKTVDKVATKVLIDDIPFWRAYSENVSNLKEVLRIMAK